MTTKTLDYRQGKHSAKQAEHWTGGSQEIKAALTRIELGETPAARIKIGYRQQALILRDDQSAKSLKIDCPTFTLAELKLLSGARLGEIARLYELKIGDPTMRVVDVQTTGGKSQ